MAAIEIKELRNFDGTINEMIKVLEKYRRRYPGYKVEWYERDSNYPGRDATFFIVVEEKKEKKDDRSKGIFRTKNRIEGTQKDS